VSLPPQPAAGVVDDKRVALAAAPYLTRGVDLADLLKQLIDSIVDELDAERGTLYLVDGGAQTLTSIVAHLPELPQIRLAIGQGIAGAAAQTGKPVLVPDAASDPRHDPTFDLRTGFHTRSLLAVPLRDSEGEVIAVLQTVNARSKPGFDVDDVKKAVVLGAQAGQVLERTSLYANLKKESRTGEARPPLAFRFNHIIGEADGMQRVYRLVEKAARTEATVLIQGESGTGKELIARAIHVNSERKDGPFVKVDCTTLPEALIENELFGHEKGAFTGADKTVPGKFEVAGGGTLFLDEMGELPLQVQGKLLRVLQDREFERVGGTKTLRCDIRVVCATHRDLEAMVDEGKFREDLFYRVRVVPLTLPPLRERGSTDLVRLVEHFVDRFSRRHRRDIHRLTDDALRRLKQHPFPGNVRELENCIESAVVLCEDGVIDADDLPLSRRRRPTTGITTEGAPVDDVSGLGAPNVTLAAVELAHMRAVLDACNGNQSEAARRLDINRNTLKRRLALQESVDDSSAS